MNLAEMIYRTAPTGEVIAWFGQAHLLKAPDGRLEVVGGSPQDRAAARHWASQFLGVDVVETLPHAPCPANPLSDSHEP